MTLYPVCPRSAGPRPWAGVRWSPRQREASLAEKCGNGAPAACRAPPAPRTEAADTATSPPRPVLLRARRRGTRVRLRVPLLEKTCHTWATQVPPLELPHHPHVSAYRSQGPAQRQAAGKPSIGGGASPGGPSPSHRARLSRLKGAAGTGQLADRRGRPRIDLRPHRHQPRGPRASHCTSPSLSFPSTLWDHSGSLEGIELRLGSSLW